MNNIRWMDEEMDGRTHTYIRMYRQTHACTDRWIDIHVHV